MIWIVLVLVSSGLSWSQDDGPPSTEMTTVPSLPYSPSEPLPPMPTLPPLEPPETVDANPSKFAEHCAPAAVFRKADPKSDEGKSVNSVIQQATAEMDREIRNLTVKAKGSSGDVYDKFKMDNQAEPELARVFEEFKGSSQTFSKRFSKGGDMFAQVQSCLPRAGEATGRGSALGTNILYSKKFIIARYVFSRRAKQELAKVEASSSKAKFLQMRLNLAKQDLDKCLINYWKFAQTKIVYRPKQSDGEVRYSAQCPREKYEAFKTATGQAFDDLMAPLRGFGENAAPVAQPAKPAIDPESAVTQ